MPLPDFGYGEPRTREIGEQMLEVTDTLKGYNDYPITLNGGVTLGAGSAGSPSVRIGEATTGFFRPGAAKLGLTLGAEEKVRVTTTGVRIEPSGVAGDPANALDVRGSGTLLRFSGSSITASNAVSGGGDAIPSNVVGYLKANIGGNERLIPYFDPA